MLPGEPRQLNHSSQAVAGQSWIIEDGNRVTLSRRCSIATSPILASFALHGQGSVPILARAWPWPWPRPLEAPALAMALALGPKLWIELLQKVQAPLGFGRTARSSRRCR